MPKNQAAVQTGRRVGIQRMERQVEGGRKRKGWAWWLNLQMEAGGQEEDGWDGGWMDGLDGRLDG